MTRINLIDAAELFDQHLIAEYREIRLLVASLRKSFATSRGITKDRIPPRFTLNQGHILFFADKGRYIAQRFQQLREEMIERGFTPQYSQIDTTVWPRGFFRDWSPDQSAFALIRARIADRVARKPAWYRYSGKIKECAVRQYWAALHSTNQPTTKESKS